MMALENIVVANFFCFIFLISVENEQYELATRLGEKYLDFQVLVLIADRTNNQAKLTEYNEKFKDYVSPSNKLYGTHECKIIFHLCF